MIKAFLRAALKPLSFIPAIVMMYLIYSFSAQDGTASGNLSYRVSEIIVETANEAFELNWTEQQEAHYIERIHYPVRKLAHMTEYFLLAMSVSLPLYAGRGPSKKDVMIDSIGIAAGVLLVQIICFIGRVTVFRPLAKKRRT